MKLGTAIAEIMKREGIEILCGYPVNHLIEYAANADIRPVIYAGQGVHYAKAWPQLKRLAERLAIPVTTSLGGKSSFPETHPLSLGSGGLAVPSFMAVSPLVQAVGPADLQQLEQDFPSP